MLGAAAESLLHDLGPPTGARTRWVAGQLRALATTCRVRAGERLSWAEQVGRCLQVTPTLGDREAYAVAHAALEGLLPGPGPLAERFAAHRTATAVPPDELPRALAAVVGLLRERVATLLPAGEALELQVVAAAPWSALCRAAGPLRSVVAVSAARPLPAAALVALAAHETYPGHHVERCLLAGRPERQVVVVATPEAVVTEGLGQTALRASGLTVADCGPLLGRDLTHADAVARAAAPLARTKADAALLLRTRGARAAHRHLTRWGLHDPARADVQLAFLQDPRWVVHAAAYGAGADLVGAWLDAGRPYADLLGRPVTPDDLRVGA